MVLDKCFTMFLGSSVCFFAPLFYRYFGSPSVGQALGDGGNSAQQRAFSIVTKRGKEREREKGEGKR